MSNSVDQNALPGEFDEPLYNLDFLFPTAGRDLGILPIDSHQQEINLALSAVTRANDGHYAQNVSGQAGSSNQGTTAQTGRHSHSETLCPAPSQAASAVTAQEPQSQKNRLAQKRYRERKKVCNIHIAGLQVPRSETMLSYNLWLDLLLDYLSTKDFSVRDSCGAVFGHVQVQFNSQQEQIKGMSEELQRMSVALAEADRRTQELERALALRDSMPHRLQPKGSGTPESEESIPEPLHPDFLKAYAVFHSLLYPAKDVRSGIESQPSCNPGPSDIVRMAEDYRTRLVKLMLHINEGTREGIHQDIVKLVEARRQQMTVMVKHMPDFLAQVGHFIRRRGIESGRFIPEPALQRLVLVVQPLQEAHAEVEAWPNRPDAIMIADLIKQELEGYQTGQI